jgi:hypothetical protein
MLRLYSRFHRPSLRRELGASRFTFLLLLALIAAPIYLVAMFIPAHLGNQHLHEAAEEIVRRGAQQNLSDADVRAQLHEKVREFGLPDNHHVDLWHEGKGLAARISYTHVIRFPFYMYQWPVEIRVKNIGF